MLSADGHATTRGKNAEFLFVQADDLAILADVRRMGQEIVRMEEEKNGDGKGKVDQLVLSQGAYQFQKAG